MTSGLSVTKVSPAGTTGVIVIPTTTSGPPQGPTGQVNNTNTSSFVIPTSTGGNGAFAHFIFANLNGTISAWNSGSTAFIQPSATISGAVYTGLAINQAQTMLYAANNAAGTIDVFNSSFSPVTLSAGAFATPTAFSILGLVPFNVQDIGGDVYVTYAPAGETAQETAALGEGGVAVFDESGDPLSVLITGIPGGPATPPLAAPWGVALAPASGFGQFSGDLLVGNFSYLNSEINAFDPTTGMFEGTIPIGGSGYTPGGLWALEFGIGGSNGSPDTLFFTDGINGEADGLFGAITVAVAEPPGLTVLAPGLVFLGVWQFARRSRAART